MEKLPENDVQLHLVAGAVRRRWALVLVVMLVLAAAVGAYAMSRPTTYASTAKVLMRPVPGNALSPNLSNGQQVVIAVQTESTLVNSPGVAKLVSDKLHRTVHAGSPSVKATVPPNTQVVEIEYTDKSAAAAQAGADAYAESFLEYRTAQATSAQSYQLSSLKDQAKAVEDNLKKATKAAAGDQSLADAAAQVQVYATRLASLQESIGQLQSGKVDAGTVITPAPLPGSPTGIAPAVYIVAAALLGLGLGLAGAIALERKDNRVRSSVEPVIAGRPVLARLPRGARGASAEVALSAADDSVRNAYRVARVGITANLRRGSVMVVSAVREEDSSPTVATNLACSLSDAGHRVVLVDAALGGYGVAEVLGVTGGPRLHEALVDPGVAVALLGQDKGLGVLSAGPPSRETRELLGGTRFVSLLEALREGCDYVVVHAAPALSADGDAVAVAGDGVVHVITDLRTTHEQVDRAVARAESLGVEVLGAICLPVARKSIRRTRSARPVGPGQHSARSKALDTPPVEAPGKSPVVAVAGMARTTAVNATRDGR